MRARGEFSEGDYGCVVYPGLSTTVNPELVVSKTFKDISSKRREEHIYENIISRYQNDFIVTLVDDTINPQGNPEIRQCRMGKDKHIIRDDEIVNNTLIYEYLGKTYNQIFRVMPEDPRPYLDALIILILKVIEMNKNGLSHNDIDLNNITYKDGKAYLIDIGQFTYFPGTINFQDIRDLLGILYRIDTHMNESNRSILQGYTRMSITQGNIEQIKAFILSLNQPIAPVNVPSQQGATAPRLLGTPTNFAENYTGATAPRLVDIPGNSAINLAGNYAGGTRKKKKKSTKRTKAKTKSKAKAKVK
jgi:hypothetical protein